jgi:DNA-binding transcriptional MerR regulator
MPTITFDTLNFIRKLRDAGFEEKQAKALADAFKEASAESDQATTKDLQIELAPVRADITLLKWMVGAILAGVISLVMKSFY